MRNANCPICLKSGKTTKVKQHIARLFGRNDWAAAGGGWQGLSSELQLTGWSRKRRVIVLRRLVRESLAITAAGSDAGRQGELFGTLEVLKAGDLYEYAVLVTPLEEEILGIAQLYRDRAEAENVFDEFKEPVGLGRLHDAGSPALSDSGPDRGADLQLVESVHQAGHPEPAYGSDDQPAVAVAWSRPSNHAQQPDHADDHQQPRASRADPPSAGRRKSITTNTCSHCGAVYGRATLALAPAVHFSRLAQSAPARSAVSAIDRLGELPDLGRKRCSQPFSRRLCSAKTRSRVWPRP